MKKPILILITIAAVVAAGCKKSNNDPSPDASDTYLPVTSGTTWTYDDVIGTSHGTDIITLTGATSTINGKKYYALTGDKNGTKTTGYFYAADHSYALRGSNASVGITLEIQLGNDSQPAGYTWTTHPTDDGLVEGIPAQTINKIIAKGISKTVNGKSYDNVIHTQVTLQYNIGGYQTAAVYDIYMAKGIGMIEEDTDMTMVGLAYEKQTLKSYTIK